MTFLNAYCKLVSWLNVLNINLLSSPCWTSFVRNKSCTISCFSQQIHLSTYSNTKNQNKFYLVICSSPLIWKLLCRASQTLVGPKNELILHFLSSKNCCPCMSVQKDNGTKVRQVCFASQRKVLIFKANVLRCNNWKEESFPTTSSTF